MTYMTEGDIIKKVEEKVKALPPTWVYWIIAILGVIGVITVIVLYLRQRREAKE